MHYATALSLGSASVPEPAHPEQAIVLPGQPVRWVPCGQQCPFDICHLEQSKTLPLPWQCWHSVLAEAIPIFYPTQTH